MKNIGLSFLTLILLSSCSQSTLDSNVDSTTFPNLNYQQANKLAELPLSCIQTEYPNKIGITFTTEHNVKEPHELHPAFYGCFDWHSSVHGHWSLVKLLKKFPNLKKADTIKSKLLQNLTKQNIEIEVAIFQGKNNKSFERTYGWAWLLKLAEELHTWDDSLARNLEQNLQPLTNHIVNSYLKFLPKLKYPIRVGEHTNTAFGLSFAWDYSLAIQDKVLQEIIEQTAKRFYYNDINCPLTWEPGGYDFLSPCLEEIDLMRRVLSKTDFKKWIDKFMPQLSSRKFKLDVANVTDRADGKLVHLDGLNFSRAWVLYGLANEYDEFTHLFKIAIMLIFHFPTL